MSRAMQVAQKRRDLPTLPGLELLDRVDPNKKVNFTADQLARLSELLEIKLQEFNVKAQVVEAQPGPVVTRFELDLAPGVKASKVTNISRDLARSMSMASVRVVEVIPGKPYIGIEVPNSSREMVRLIELLETPTYRDPNNLISMAMGKDISGNPVITELGKAPHMLVAGTTGSGKSVGVNAMLLSILDLENVTVNDIMVPRHEVLGIDLDDSLEEILTQIRTSQHTRLPVYKGDINNIIGMLHLRNAARFLSRDEVTKAAIVQEAREPYFIPESTPLHTQLLNFQKQKRRIGIVVDEYGDVEGLVTLEDILEEIVGEFTTDVSEDDEIHQQDDGSHVIEGTANIREINKMLGWQLPTDGPKTLNGLILEHLESFPDGPACLQIGNTRMEILEIRDNLITSARCWQKLRLPRR